MRIFFATLAWTTSLAFSLASSPSMVLRISLSLLPPTSGCIKLTLYFLIKEYVYSYSQIQELKNTWSWLKSSPLLVIKCTRKLGPISPPKRSPLLPSTPLMTLTLQPQTPSYVPVSFFHSPCLRRVVFWSHLICFCRSAWKFLHFVSHDVRWKVSGVGLEHFSRHGKALSCFKRLFLPQRRSLISYRKGRPSGNLLLCRNVEVPLPHILNTWILSTGWVCLQHRSASLQGLEEVIYTSQGLMKRTCLGLKLNFWLQYLNGLIEHQSQREDHWIGRGWTKHVGLIQY